MRHVPCLSRNIKHFHLLVLKIYKKKRKQKQLKKKAEVIPSFVFHFMIMLLAV